MKIWVVLCRNGGRIASVENMKTIKEKSYYNVMFRNYDGTVYLNVTGIKKEKLK